MVAPLRSKNLAILLLPCWQLKMSSVLPYSSLVSICTPSSSTLSSESKLLFLTLKIALCTSLLAASSPSPPAWSPAMSWSTVVNSLGCRSIMSFRLLTFSSSSIFSLFIRTSVILTTLSMSSRQFLTNKLSILISLNPLSSFSKFNTSFGSSIPTIKGLLGLL